MINLREVYARANALNATKAEEHYHLAEHYFEAKAFEIADAQCRWALYFNPEHPAAGALWINTQPKIERNNPEVYFRLKAMSGHAWQSSMMPAEALLEKGNELFSRADFDEAEHAYQEALDLFREVCPPSIEAPMRIEKAQFRLRQISAIRRDAWDW